MNADEIEAPEEVQSQGDICTQDMPTQAEMAEHKDNAMHNTGIGAPTASRDLGENALTSSPPVSVSPLISCDDVYISPTGVFARDELSEKERAGALKVLVAYCGTTKIQFAHAVPRKRGRPRRVHCGVAQAGHAAAWAREGRDPQRQ